MIETKRQQECQYCHSLKNDNGVSHGRTLAYHTDYYDHHENRVAQHQRAGITSPEYKHPRIKVGRTNKYGSWISVIKIPINYCPICGRKLGDDSTDQPE